MDLHREPFEAGGELREDRQRGEALVGDDERALHAMPLQVLGDELARAGTEMDFSWEGEFRDRHASLSARLCPQMNADERRKASGVRSIRANGSIVTKHPSGLGLPRSPAFIRG